MRITENIRGVSGEELEANRYGRDRRIDAKHHIPVRDNIFNTLELTNIKNVLYETKQEEFVGGQIFTQTNEWMAGAREVGYDIMEPVGEARIGASGGQAKDIPFVTEKLQEKTQKAVEIEVGIKYTRNELEVADAKSTIGRGPILNLVQTRATTARRTISRLFDKGVFQGYSEYGVSGLQSIMPAIRQTSLPTNNRTTIYEKVDNTGTSSSTLWSAKSGQNIIKNLNRGKYQGVGRANIFNGRTLIVDTAAYGLLANPYSDLDGHSIISYLMEAKTFTNIYQTNAVAITTNGRLNTYFVICDDELDIAEIPILRPITVFPSQEDWTGETKQLVALRFAGLMVRYPGAFYFADGHIEAPNAAYD